MPTREELQAAEDRFAERQRMWRYQDRVLETLVYFASEKGQKKLPTISEFVLSEVVAATIEYLTGEEYRFTYERLEDGSEFAGVADDWYWKTNKAMEKVLEQYGDRLGSDLKEALRQLTELRFCSDAMGGKGYNNSLAAHYKHGICQVLMVSTFSLSVDFVRKVEKKVIPSLDRETLRHCRAIARIMRKYIRKDLSLIARKYHW